MESNFIKEQNYIKAKKRVKEIKAFYTHLTVYCIVIPILIFINLNYEPHVHWFWFSLIGWGIGLFSHWLHTFGFKKMGFGKDWEENKIKELMEEQHNTK